MSGISSLGVGSGLELGALVDSLMRAERAPVQGRLDRGELKAKTQLSAIGVLQAATGGLQAALDGLRTFSTQLKATATGSDAVVAALTDRNGLGADAGSYQVQVQRLASAQSLATDAFAAADVPLGTGSMTLRVGDNEVTIEVGNNDLRGLRDAINASDAGVQAVVVQDGGAYRLLLTSAESGAAGTMDITLTGSLDARLASAAMTETMAAEDAEFSVNGLTLSSASNRIEGVIPGVTLTLQNVTEGAERATVTVEQDRAAVRERLEALVNAYNVLRENMGSLGAYNAETGTGGPLLGDSILRGLQSRVNGVFSTALATEQPDNPFGSMSDLGFSVALNGRVTLDAARLDEVLGSDQEAVEALVSAFATGLSETLAGYTGNSGILNSRTDGLNAELRRIGEQREALDRRMIQVETRLRAQFTALDAMVAQFQNTSSFLTDQLASLADLRPGRRD